MCNVKAIQVRITDKQRDYIDKLIREDKFASYGQSLRALLGYYKRHTREIERLKRENIVLRAKVKGDFDDVLVEKRAPEASGARF